jgi:putative ABC transport system substrate-binding protein
LPALAGETVRLKPDIILAAAIDAAVAAHNATSTIPIIGSLADPVHLGLIASEARPGGNVTGIEPYLPGLPAKQMEFAREIAPGATRVGIVTHMQDPKAPPQWQELKRAARDLEITIVDADVDAPEKIDGAFQKFASERVGVVIVLQTTLLLNQGRRIADAALEKRLPTVFGYRENVAAGGLISYGVDLRGIYRRAAYFVDRVLRGTSPGELPRRWV